MMAFVKGKVILWKPFHFKLPSNGGLGAVLKGVQNVSNTVCDKQQKIHKFDTTRITDQLKL